jgi:hypothetical protein
MNPTKLGGKLADLSADVPLDPFVRCLSRIVERMFEDTGEITSAWFAVTRAGEGHIIATPISSGPTDFVRGYGQKQPR